MKRADNRIANASFVCALLVLFIHLEQVPQTVGSVSWAIYYVIRYVLAVAAVPFFFTVSGYFLAGRIGTFGGWRRSVAKRIRTLGVPFLVWSVVPLLVFSVFWTSCDSEGICPRVPFRLSSMAAAFGLHLLTLPEANRPLWYLRALFFLVLVSPALLAFVKRGGRPALVLLLALYWSLNPWSLDAPHWWLGMTARVFWTFVFSAEGLFYFSLGLYLASHPVSLPRRPAIALGAVGLLVGIGGMLMEMNGVPDFGYAKLVVIPPVLCLIWGLVPDRPWPVWLVGNAFAVYMVHPVLVRSMNAAGMFPNVSWAYVIEWCGAAGASLGLVGLLRRFAPRTTGWAFGGR